MGIIPAELAKRLNLFEQAVKVYGKELIKIEKTTDKEDVKNELINTFE